MGLQFFGNDAYYHMRRIAYSLANFPTVLEFDRYINFPDGARPIWSPTFDWSIAALFFPLRGSLTTEALERLVVWIPPLLGGATVVILYHLARKQFGGGVAALAGLFLALLSGHFWYSQIGFIDHHAAVSFVVTLLLAAGMEFFRRATDQPEGLRPGLGGSIRMGLLFAATLLVWPGTLLHVGLLEVALLVYMLTRIERHHAVAAFGSACRPARLQCRPTALP